MSIIKEVREFFTRHVRVLSGSKRDREMGFPTTHTVTDIAGNIVTVYNRLLANDYPSDAVFAKLLESITFKLNPEDAATLTAQGLVKLASTAEVNAGTNTDSNLYSLVVRPSDVKTIIDNLAALTNIVGNLPTINNKIYFGNTVPTTGTYNINDIFIITTEGVTFGTFYKCTSITPLTWTQQVILNKVPTGGTTGQVLSKQSNSNYDVIWRNSALPIGTLFYAARITQTDTNAPVVDFVYYDSIGITNIIRSAVGRYEVIKTGIFPQTKTIVMIDIIRTDSDGISGIVEMYVTDTNQVFIQNRDLSGDNVDGLFNKNIYIIILP